MTRDDVRTAHPELPGPEGDLSASLEEEVASFQALPPWFKRQRRHANAVPGG